MHNIEAVGGNGKERHPGSPPWAFSLTPAKKRDFGALRTKRNDPLFVGGLRGKTHFPSALTRNKCRRVSKLRATKDATARTAWRIKVHFPKTFSLSESSAGYVSALLQRYAEEKPTELGDLALGRSIVCFVIDVGRGRSIRR